MKQQELDAIRARLDNLGGKWELRDNILILGGSHKDLAVHAPADLRALLDQHDADQARIAVLESALQELRDGLED